MIVLKEGKGHRMLVCVWTAALNKALGGTNIGYGFKLHPIPMKYFHRGRKNSQADMITVIHNLLADACINFNIRSHKLKQENCKASHKTKVDIESFISTILQKNNSMKIIYLHWLAVISSIAAVMQTLFNYWNNLALQFVGIPYLKWIFQKLDLKDHLLTHVPVTHSDIRIKYLGFDIIKLLSVSNNSSITFAGPILLCVYIVDYIQHDQHVVKTQ